MFEDYLQDSYEFLTLAQNASDEREARRFYRASVFYALGAMEAFVNYIADSFAKAKSLTQHEIAFLNDKNLSFSAKKGKVIEKTEFHRLDDKLRLLLRKFASDFDFKGASWFGFKKFKDFRDSLVHPRQMDDETSIKDYQNRLQIGLSGIIDIMNFLSRGIFGKPLRKKLLDLVPE